MRLGLRRFPLAYQPLRWANRIGRPRVRKSFCDLARSVIPASVKWGPPKGYSSDYERLRLAPAEGRIVLTDQGSPELPKPSIMLLCKRNQHLEQPWPIFWSRHRKARLVGTSLAHLNGNKQMSVEAGYGRRRVFSDPAYNYFVASPPVCLSGAWTSLVSNWWSNDGPQPYAHWLLDALPRLAVLSEFPASTGILIPPHKLPYVTQSLEMLRLIDRCRHTPERHLEIDDYYFSSPTSMIVCYNPYAVEFLRRSFLPLARENSALPKRFFIRRTSYGRNMVNEQEVLDFFRKLGWAIVDTGQMSFLEQIQLFAGAEAIAAVHGSSTANMVWCSRGCKVLELFASSYMAGDQEWIAQCVHAEYHFMIFPSDHKLNALIDLQGVGQKLRQMGLKL